MHNWILEADVGEQYTIEQFFHGTLDSRQEDFVREFLQQKETIGEDELPKIEYDIEDIARAVSHHFGTIFKEGTSKNPDSEKIKGCFQAVYDLYFEILKEPTATYQYVWIAFLSTDLLYLVDSTEMLKAFSALINAKDINKNNASSDTRRLQKA